MGGERPLLGYLLIVKLPVQEITLLEIKWVQMGIRLFQPLFHSTAVSLRYNYISTIQQPQPDGSRGVTDVNAGMVGLIAPRQHL